MAHPYYRRGGGFDRSGGSSYPDRGANSGSDRNAPFPPRVPLDAPGGQHANRPPYGYGSAGRGYAGHADAYRVPYDGDYRDRSRSQSDYPRAPYDRNLGSSGDSYPPPYMGGSGYPYKDRAGPDQSFDRHHADRAWGNRAGSRSYEHHSVQAGHVQPSGSLFSHQSNSADSSRGDRQPLSPSSDRKGSSRSTGSAATSSAPYASGSMDMDTSSDRPFTSSAADSSISSARYDSSQHGGHGSGYINRPPPRSRFRPLVMSPTLPTTHASTDSASLSTSSGHSADRNRHSTVTDMDVDAADSVAFVAAAVSSAASKASTTSSLTAASSISSPPAPRQSRFSAAPPAPISQSMTHAGPVSSPTTPAGPALHLSQSAGSTHHALHSVAYASSSSAAAEQGLQRPAASVAAQSTSSAAGGDARWSVQYPSSRVGSAMTTQAARPSSSMTTSSPAVSQSAPTVAGVGIASSGSATSATAQPATPGRNVSVALPKSSPPHNTAGAPVTTGAAAGSQSHTATTSTAVSSTPASEPVISLSVLSPDLPAFPSVPVAGRRDGDVSAGSNTQLDPALRAVNAAEKRAQRCQEDARKARDTYFARSRDFFCRVQPAIECMQVSDQRVLAECQMYRQTVQTFTISS